MPLYCRIKPKKRKKQKNIPAEKFFRNIFVKKPVDFLLERDMIKATKVNIQLLHFSNKK